MYFNYTDVSFLHVYFNLLHIRSDVFQYHAMFCRINEIPIVHYFMVYKIIGLYIILWFIRRFLWFMEDT